MNTSPVREVPKKVKAALAKLGIRNVVGGYSTVTSVRLVQKAAFTCWNKHGKVVCVLVKGPGESEWTKK